MTKRIGSQSVAFKNPPAILGHAAVVAGAKEAEGPLGHSFDRIVEDIMLGESSWEKAESKLMNTALLMAIEKAGVTAKDINYLFGGDLLNQCISASYAVRDTDIPFYGIYGACSNMAMGLGLSAMMVDGGFAEQAIAVTSSHFCAAEKQFRFPLEYGGQRTPSAQWTVTGSGAAVVGMGSGPVVTQVTTGKIVDKGIKDIANMGAAMAPAFVDTIIAHFSDSGRKPGYYDMIVSGDLGLVGRDIANDLLISEGLGISQRYDDCGCMIFDPKSQDTHSGGSGCGCSASVLCGHLLNEMRAGKLRRLLFVSTGALMSPTSALQGESIPSIAHAAAIEML